MVFTSAAMTKVTAQSLLLYSFLEGAEILPTQGVHKDKEEPNGHRISRSWKCAAPANFSSAPR